MTKYFLEFTPVLYVANGDRYELGTIRYELEDHMLGNPSPGKTVTRLVTLFSDGGPTTMPMSIVEMAMQVIRADVPQPVIVPTIQPVTVNQ